MNLHRLRLFRAVAERGSFVLAAKELSITQPALSMQIKRLENELGVKLLVRNPNLIVPTPAGRLLYKTATAIDEQLALIERRIGALIQGREGEFTFAVSPSGVLCYLSEAMKRFRRLRPGVSFSLQVVSREDVVNLVTSGRVDMGFEWEPIPPRNVQQMQLVRSRYSIVVPPCHRWAGKRKVSKDEFEDEPFIALDYGLGIPSVVEVSLFHTGIKPKIKMRVPSVDALKRAVEADLGVTILSTLTAARELRQGTLKTLQLAEFRMERHVTAFWRRGFDVPQTLREFLKNAARHAAVSRPALATPEDTPPAIVGDGHR